MQIWKIRKSDPRFEVVAIELFGDSFVRRTTVSIAEEVVGHGLVNEYVFGDADVSIGGGVAQLREIHRLVFAKVTARQHALVTVKDILEGDEVRDLAEQLVWDQLGLGAEEAKKPIQFWTVKLDGFSGIELHPKEPFGDSFIYRETQKAAEAIFPTLTTRAQWGGSSGTHVSIPRDAGLDKMRELRELVTAAVSERMAHFSAVKAELESPVYNEQPLWRVEIAGFGGIELRPTQEPLRGRTPASERCHGIAPVEDYFIYYGTERVAKTIFSSRVRSNWARPGGSNIEIPRDCTVEQARELREKVTALLTERAAQLDEHERKAAEEAQAEQQVGHTLNVILQKMQEFEKIIANYESARERLLKAARELGHQ